MASKRWLTDGPKLGEIIEAIDDKRTAKNEVAIIIPTFKGKSRLERQFEYLKKQTYRNFDVILVYGYEDEFIQNPEFSIVHLKRNDDYGSAGGYYAGERYVLEQNYPYVIMADDDCFPVDENVIKELVAELKKENVIVFPASDVGDPNSMPQLMGFFASMRTDIIRKAGLTWIPFHYYCEDIEWHDRLIPHSKNKDIPNQVVHKTKQGYFFNSSAYYRVRNCILYEFMARNNGRFVSFLWTFVFSGLSLAILDTPRAQYLFNAIRDFLTVQLFKGNPLPEQSMKGLELPNNAHLVTYTNRNQIAKGLGEYARCFNKVIYADKAGYTGTWPLFLYILGKEFFIVDGESKPVFRAHASLVRKILWFIFLPALLCLTSVMTILIFIYAYLFLPYYIGKNKGYGVPI